VRWFFLEAANGATTAKLVEVANRRRFATKTGKIGAWSGREVLRLLRNPTYAGRLSDGSSAIHTAVVEPELWDRVQSTIGDRKTRASSDRSRPDANFDPFILRGLLTCGPCGRTLTTSMSTKLTAKTAKSAPRYYRCPTPGCGGQIVATEAERLALEALSEPPAHWPEDVRARLREHAAVWDGLWRINRRRTLAEVFASMSWRRKPERLDVGLADGPREPE